MVRSSTESRARNATRRNTSEGRRSDGCAALGEKSAPDEGLRELDPYSRLEGNVHMRLT